MLLGEAGADEAIGFDTNDFVDFFRFGGNGLEIVGSVVAGCAIPFRTEGGQVALQVGTFSGAFEQHVFEQVSHAGFAVAFEFAAGFDDQFNARVGSGGVGRENDFEPVRQHIGGKSCRLHVEAGKACRGSSGHAWNEQSGEQNDGSAETGHVCETPCSQILVGLSFVECNFIVAVNLVRVKGIALSADYLIVGIVGCFPGFW